MLRPRTSSVRLPLGGAQTDHSMCGRKPGWRKAFGTSDVGRKNVCQSLKCPSASPHLSLYEEEYGHEEARFPEPGDEEDGACSQVEGYHCRPPSTVGGSHREDRSRPSGSHSPCGCAR